MVTLDVVDAIKQRLPELYGSKGPHDASHIERAFKYCSVAGEAFTPMAQILVLLHDVGNLKCVGNGDSFFKHADYSATEAESILKEYNLNKAEIGIITSAIRNHEFLQFEKKNLEPKVVELLKIQHNEYVDAIGALGIVRQAQCSIELKESEYTYLNNVFRLHNYYSGFEFHPGLKSLENLKRENAKKILGTEDGKKCLWDIYTVSNQKDNVTLDIMEALPSPLRGMVDAELNYKL
jgi:hypothetical protein